MLVLLPVLKRGFFCEQFKMPVKIRKVIKAAFITDI